MTVQRYACHTTMEITENQHSNKKRRQTCDGKTPHEAGHQLQGGMAPPRPKEGEAA